MWLDALLHTVQVPGWAVEADGTTAVHVRNMFRPDATNSLPRRFLSELYYPFPVETYAFQAFYGV